MIGNGFDPTSIIISDTYIQAFQQCGAQIIKNVSDKKVSTISSFEEVNGWYVELAAQTSRPHLGWKYIKTHWIGDAPI